MFHSIQGINAKKYSTEKIIAYLGQFYRVWDRSLVILFHFKHYLRVDGCRHVEVEGPSLHPSGELEIVDADASDEGAEGSRCSGVAT